MLSQFGLQYIPINLSNMVLAYEIQKRQWPETPDYNGLYDKAAHTTDDNIEFLVYHNETLLGITGIDRIEEYSDSIWLDWFTILPEYRRKGFGKKVLLDTIEYCKKLNRYKNFRIDTTYYEGRPALFLYDEIMDLREEYTAEDTDECKNNFLIYTKGLKGKPERWNNCYLGLKEYYDTCK